MLRYLDKLRELSVTNMFHASAHLAAEFGMDNFDARAVITYWMETFGKDDR
jgi:hypothetical protein